LEDIMPTQRVEAISVSFKLDVDVTDLAQLQAAFEKAVPGSAKRDAIHSQMKAMYDYASGRLEGEMTAYMNIARKKLKDLYRL
jgi:hypothetical protein